MTTTISVSGRLATVTTTDRLVAGNTYPVTLALDSEWTGSLFMRVRFGSQYYDIPFASSDTAVNVQFPVGYPEVGLGVFSEALEICSNEVRVRLLRSILEQGVSVVDFDSDLYDQWAGEVSELLCDDDFDAESQRPVKNSVLTAWKNTVPLDSALVHKTGSEEIAGNKKFTSSSTWEMGTPAMYLKSNTQSTGTGRRATLSVTDAYGGSETMFGEDRWGLSSGGYTYRAIALNKPDRSEEQYVQIRSYPNSFQIYSPTYYPVDGSGNPRPPAADMLMTSGNIAVDPRIVHTTGNETIAGDKTLTGMPVVSASQSTVEMASTTSASTTGWKSVVNHRDQGSLLANSIVMVNSNNNCMETRVYKPDRSGYNWIRHNVYSDHEELLMQPYYPVDGSGNPQPLTAGALVSSGNVAVDPRIVHTTGNETIAGAKTFSKPTSLAIHESLSNNAWGWRKMLVSPTFSNQNDVNIAIFELTDNTGHHARFQLTGRSASLIALKIVFGDYLTNNIKVSRDSNGEITIWSRAYRVIATLLYEVHAGSNTVTFTDSGTTALFDEPTTDTYAQVIQPN